MWDKVKQVISNMRSVPPEPQTGYKIHVTPLTDDGVMGTSFTVLSWDKNELVKIRETLNADSGADRFKDFVWLKFSTTVPSGEYQFRMDWLLRLGGYLVSHVMEASQQHPPASICSGAKVLPRLLGIPSEPNYANFAKSIYNWYSGEEDGWAPAIFLAAGLSTSATFIHSKRIPEFLKPLPEFLAGTYLHDITKMLQGRKVLRIKQDVGYRNYADNLLSEIFDAETSLDSSIDLGVGKGSFLLVTLSKGKSA